MNKRLIGVSISIGLAVCAVFSYQVFNKTESKTVADVTVKQPTVEYQLHRPKEYTSLSDLKKDAKYIVIANFVEKKPAVPEHEMYRTENVFHVEKVIKGDTSVADQNILVNETGGVVNGTKYVAEDNELFDAGLYLLFLDKLDDHKIIPYDIYVVKGVTAGKFKLENGKVKAFGKDKVRAQAEKLSDSELVNQAEQTQ